VSTAVPYIVPETLAELYADLDAYCNVVELIRLNYMGDEREHRISLLRYPVTRVVNSWLQDHPNESQRKWEIADYVRDKLGIPIIYSATSNDRNLDLETENRLLHYDACLAEIFFELDNDPEVKGYLDNPQSRAFLKERLAQFKNEST